MAQSTYGVKLRYWDAKKDSTGGFTKLIDIKDFPDLGGEPEMLQTTTLSDAAHTYIKGIQSMDALNFTANLEPNDYINSVKKLDDGNLYLFELAFGEGKKDKNPNHKIYFYWEGQLTAWVNGGGVDEVVETTISITPSTEIIESLTRKTKEAFEKEFDDEDDDN